MSIKVYSYNVLNPDPNTSNTLFRHIIDGNFKNKIEKARKISEVDLIRYQFYKKKKLLELFDTWLKDDAIICLQEVFDDLLSVLNKRYKITYTKTKDKILLSTGPIYKPEYRVIILSKNLKLIKSKEIDIKTELIQKNIMYNKVSNGKNILQCINVHMHWKNGVSEMEMVADEINKVLTKDPYVICGDFNKVFTSRIVQSFTSHLSIDNLTDLKNVKNKFTSFTNLKEDVKDSCNVDIYSKIKSHFIKLNIDGIYVDYLIVGNLGKNKCSKIKIIEKNKKEHLMYDLPRLEEGNKLFDSKFFTHADKKLYAKKWIELNTKSNCIDLSDHKPVMINIF